MNVDLHVHSRLSKMFEFDAESVERLARLGRRRGLDGFALTEHIHAVNFWEMHEELSQRYPYRDGAYHLNELDGFAVLSGAEVTVQERVDFIVVGPIDQLRALDMAFSPRLSEWNHAPAVELLVAIGGLDLVAILAHPFRAGKETASSSHASSIS